MPISMHEHPLLRPKSVSLKSNYKCTFAQNLSSISRIYTSVCIRKVIYNIDLQVISVYYLVLCRHIFCLINYLR